MRKSFRWVTPFIVLAVTAQLVALGYFVRTVEGQPTLPEKAASWTYVGNSQCKVCHNSAKEGSQWDKWKEAGHARAYQALQSNEAKKIAEERGMEKPPHESAECLKCHVTGYDAATASAPAKIDLADGIQCESCHGPSSEHIKDGRTLKFSPDKIGELDIMAHKVAPDEALCRSCHNEESPTWDTSRYTLEDGTTVAFDFEQAWAKVNHAFPEGAMEEKYSGAYPAD
jgi:hypothetical protein